MFKALSGRVVALLTGQQGQWMGGKQREFLVLAKLLKKGCDTNLERGYTGDTISIIALDAKIMGRHDFVIPPLAIGPCSADSLRRPRPFVCLCSQPRKEMYQLV